ncbi:MAG: phenylacetate-CoA oxygenase subunit PaaJ [Bacteroidia bacterium]|nr:phenylacetate-CoA oxygenase subunit PaaJ [Bacteroidia bacterium]
MVLSKENIFHLLSQIPDPEIPVINILELGVLRDVVFVGDKIKIKITPTYSGCPAMKQMEDDIYKLLKQEGIDNAEVEMIYNPAWTTDWITEGAKKKLLEYGIVPPQHSTSDKSHLIGKQKNIACPRCKSLNTELVSQFGSTACKALYKCKDCLEPFDYFKCI